MISCPISATRKYFSQRIFSSPKIFNRQVPAADRAVAAEERGALAAEVRVQAGRALRLQRAGEAREEAVTVASIYIVSRIDI